MSNPFPTEDVACPLGCHRHDETILVGQDRIHDLPGQFVVVKCKQCGLMRTNPRPTPQSMANYYPDDYGPYLGTRVAANVVQVPVVEKVAFYKKPIRYIFKHFFQFNTEVMPPLPPGRMLEIGCASGSFLHHMSARGWQVQGIEFSAKAAEVASGLGYPVHAGSLETAPQPAEAFDLIVGWMVLEHLHDPIAGLKKLRNCAKSDAWLVLSVPNAGSVEFRLFGNRWYALQLPNHLYHFTPNTIRRVLDAGGWKVEKIHHQRVLSNLIASTGYVLIDKGYPRLGRKLVDYPVRSGWGNFILYPLAWLLSQFGQTGRMTIWARVKS
ncbi:MAG TPA: class I SAM-dependent methyltransferase [Gallionellaceae bacterium]